MARLPRYFVPGQLQHIILRGYNRQAIFAAEEDYLFFRDCLVEAAQRFGLGVHAYVWMTHHVHLLATPNDVASLPKTLQSAGRRYVQYFNTGARARYGKGATGRRSSIASPICLPACATSKKIRFGQGWL